MTVPNTGINTAGISAPEIGRCLFFLYKPMGLVVCEKLVGTWVQFIESEGKYQLVGVVLAGGNISPFNH